MKSVVTRVYRWGGRRLPPYLDPWHEASYMAATILSPARALRQPRRVDLRAVFGLFLLLVATGGSIVFWSASSDTRTVLVATRDLPPGSVLSATDLAVARVRVDDAI